jgi:hypothetical protein
MHPFSVLNPFSLLSDGEKRKTYDETGAIDGEDDAFQCADGDWDKHWRAMFKKVAVTMHSIAPYLFDLMFQMRFNRA